MKDKGLLGIAFICVVAAAAFMLINGRLRNENARLHNEVIVVGLAAENAAAAFSQTYASESQWRRRAVQLESEKDSLEQRMAQASVTIASPERVVITDTIIIHADTSVTFTFVDPWLEAEVDYRPIDVSASLAYTISPIKVTVGAVCSNLPDPVTGIRMATITIDRIGLAPEDGMEIVVDTAQVDPDICNHPSRFVAVENKHSFFKGVLAGALTALAWATLVG
jgi:hypothetical protein